MTVKAPVGMSLFENADCNMLSNVRVDLQLDFIYGPKEQHISHRHEFSYLVFYTGWGFLSLVYREERDLEV